MRDLIIRWGFGSHMAMGIFVNIIFSFTNNF